MAELASGVVHLVVGTHALVEQDVAFRDLGLVVIDEQHRFGVAQRAALRSKGLRPDVLLMTATPIPRTLALTDYSELDVSKIPDLPPGRKPVRTWVKPESRRDEIYQLIREQLDAGRQAYIVYPLVEESEKVELRSATAEFERLSADVFAGLRLGLLHGQLAGDEKDTTMRAFAAGEIDILVATTVIEVGIDVPNASVMIVEHAERFGLSQLHQLRGRVGRGAAESFCILISDGGPESDERLQVLARTEDGFEIARADLQLRGMGDVFGARQHGLPAFRFFDPERDDDLLFAARDDARAIIERDPELQAVDNERYRRTLATRFGEREALFGVG